jgi:hypothetical protein
MNWKEEWEKILPLLSINITLPTFSRRTQHGTSCKPEIAVEQPEQNQSCISGSRSN